MSPTSVGADEIRARALVGGSRFGRLRWVESTGSTNDDLAAAAADGAPEQVLVTDLQTAGRGRRRRVWHAPARSSAMLSLLVRDIDLADAFWAVGAVAVGAVEAIEQTCGVHAELKWPNDVLIDGRKVAGILSQVVDDAVVVGIGINANWPAELPPALAARATSINHHLGSGEAQVDRVALVAALVLRAVDHLDAGPSSTRERWKQLAATIGAEVRVERESGDVTGRAIDVAADGALLVETDGTVRRFGVGDVVHLRPAV